MLKEKQNMLNYKIYIKDILDMVSRIDKDIKVLKDLKDEKNYDSTLMRLQVIGESIKKLPKEIKSRFPEVKWKKLSSFRDLISHEYFKIMPEMMIQIIKEDLPLLKKALNK